ncbi:MAG: hypothetical protein LBU11_08400 [Zoogloeaceae bacterium]|jgi:hypothetical protein|nr:hypothetical protein [Zoogloeaceae bacterium]
MQEEHRKTLKHLGVGGVAGGSAGAALGSAMGLAGFGGAIVGTGPVGVVGAILGFAAVGAWKYGKHLLKGDPNADVRAQARQSVKNANVAFGRITSLTPECRAALEARLSHLHTQADARLRSARQALEQIPSLPKDKQRQAFIDAAASASQVPALAEQMHLFHQQLRSLCEKAPPPALPKPHVTFPLKS